MFELVSYKKLIIKSLVGSLLAGSVFGQLGLKTAVAADVNSPSNGVFGLELSYYNSAFQCGEDTTQANIKVRVYDQNDNLLTTMSKGDRYLSTSIDSVDELRFAYEIYNLSCVNSSYVYNSFSAELLDSEDTIPNLLGFDSQAYVAEMLSTLESYEELYLVELGTSNTASPAYDLQDVVLVVDNNPLLPD